MGGLDGQIVIHHVAPSILDRLGFFFFFGGWGLCFMGCNELMLVGFMGCDGLMLVGYGGWVWADFGFWLILDFSYGGRW